MAVTAYAEVNQNLRNGEHPIYSRYEVEVKKLFPSESKRAILIVRANLQATIGTQVPFFEQSSLGGRTICGATVSIALLIKISLR